MTDQTWRQAVAVLEARRFSNPPEMTSAVLDVVKRVAADVERAIYRGVVPVALNAVPSGAEFSIAGWRLAVRDHQLLVDVLVFTTADFEHDENATTRWAEWEADAYELTYPQLPIGGFVAIPIWEATADTLTLYTPLPDATDRFERLRSLCHDCWETPEDDQH